MLTSWFDVEGRYKDRLGYQQDTDGRATYVAHSGGAFEGIHATNTMMTGERTSFLTCKNKTSFPHSRRERYVFSPQANYSFRLWCHIRREQYLKNRGELNILYLHHSPIQSVSACIWCPPTQHKLILRWLIYLLSRAVKKPSRLIVPFTTHPSLVTVPLWKWWVRLIVGRPSCVTSPLKSWPRSDTIVCLQQWDTTLPFELWSSSIDVQVLSIRNNSSY